MNEHISEGIACNHARKRQKQIQKGAAVRASCLGAREGKVNAAVHRVDEGSWVNAHHKD